MKKRSELDIKYDQAVQKTAEAYRKYREAFDEEEIIYLLMETTKKAKQND